MILESPHEYGKKVVTSGQVDNGKALAEMTARWMAAHEHEFREMLGYVKSLQALGKKGRLRDRVAVWCMQHGITVEEDGYKFANAYWAGISRYMALVDPTLVGAPIRFADSDIDCYGLPSVGYLGLEE